MTVLGQPPREREKELDHKALRVFLKALDIAGGPRKLFAYRHLTWLPSLMEAAYVIVLSRERLKTQGEIARELGLTSATVRNILGADEGRVLEHLREELAKHHQDEEPVKTHIAGGLAKLAYQEIAAGHENIAFLVDILRDYLGGDDMSLSWPLEILSRLQEVAFPAERETLTERLGDLSIDGKPVRELLEHLSYPLSSPAALLRALARQRQSSATS
uniref:KaiC associated regulatory domain-containing protein n=1 Tax=Thermogemmatispora argillosa TaxID=2045280 RepID=A0A455T8K8_9CHLR|nr:KaiC associated regulatory domain-containing protein [Thermogemmatispora argillosa]